MAFHALYDAANLNVLINNIYEVFMTRGMRRIVWISASFLLISLLSRIGLAFYSGENYTVQEWGRFLALGLMFDLAVLPWFLFPWAFYDAVMPELSRHHWLSKLEGLWAGIWGILFLGLFIFVGVSEFVFWEEFGSRFDFIAVDYLIYTKEVIGNIRQSYPINTWVALMLVACGIISWFSWPKGSTIRRSDWLYRWGRAAVVAVAVAVGFYGVDHGYAESKNNAHVEQLSLNGIYAFGHAFLNNQLEYDKYYPRLDEAELNTRIRELVNQGNTTFTSDQGIERKITSDNSTKDINVVMISIESFGASYMGKFGSELNIAPELDKLADKGLLFTNFYATGTRTVRGLEAMSVGTPPIPGQSIVRRPETNSGLVTIGGEMKDKGWNPHWIYGGYGFFDNMNAYFKGNGYAVVDRTDLDEEGIPVHHETIWGVADEDLFTLALVNLDREYAKGNRFFAQIMTTSNHRPYTFPEGRIDMRQKKRESVVKYTDWAIGDFLRRSADKPWFDNTLFIIVSDHTAKAAGKTDLPPSRYHIPMIWYGPKLIEPGVMDRLMSQIDLGPTLLSWLGLDYPSRFFGYDMFNLEKGRERAFISTYQKLGYLKNGRLVVLDVNKEPVVLDGPTYIPVEKTSLSDNQLIDEAISWYQSASLYYRTGQLKDGPGNEKP